MLLPLAGLAGTIHLLPSAQVTLSNGLPVVAVELFNSGNEPVQIVSVETAVAGQTASQRSAKPFFLPAGESFRQQCPVTRPPALPGTYQAVTRIKCADIAGLPFSPVMVSDFTWMGGAKGDGWVSLSVEPVEVGRDKSVKVECLLLQDEPVDATLRLILPDEFGGGSVERKVRLTAEDTHRETFDITNHRGLAGAAYPLYAIIEQDAGGVHRSVSAEGSVMVSGNAWTGSAWWVWLAGAMGLVGVLVGWRSFVATALCRRVWTARRRAAGLQECPCWFDVTLLAILTGFILWHVSPCDLVRDTTAVGGDTPAHLYLASHLREQLFHHGRIISWAGGWWSGFPMFQFYFPLPYFVAALLSVVVPLNVAFKLASVAGLALTPLCAYLAGRLWRLPRPIPLVLAMAMVPFLFVSTHVMWGVNTASTLAGMISNSWSFALMLVALASATRDAEDGAFRLRTVVVMVLVVASHFFTSVMMFLCLAVVPVVSWSAFGGRTSCEPQTDKFRESGSRDPGPGEPRPPAERWRMALKVLSAESMLALLLMAWWLVPLVAKSGYSMDFGTNWDVSLWKSFPVYAPGLLVFAGVGFAQLCRGVVRPPMALLPWMLVISTVLFLSGFSLSPVFINIRLWPFVFFALAALAAMGLGSLLVHVRGQTLWLVALMAGFLAMAVAEDSLSGFTGPSRTRLWAEWNYSGLESKPVAPVFEKLVLPLKGTPGRLANDLCEENNQMGSSRIFELAPALAGKPVLEGGLVNSALGSMYAYTIQGETSDSCAGFPALVTPQPFDFTNATRHLELFNVKQFIARSERTKAALRGMPEWRLVGRELDWELYELMSHTGRYVFIPPRPPVVVTTERWKECSLEWLYTPSAVDQFAIWEPEGGWQRADDGRRTTESLPHLTERQFLDMVGALRKGSSSGCGKEETQCIWDEDVTDTHIRFKTSAIGRAHIIKVSWFPNWKVRGAERVYRVSPGFMLVFPERESVELYYGTVWSDWVG